MTKSAEKTKSQWPKRLADWLAVCYSRFPRLIRIAIWAVFFTGFAAYSALSIREGLKGRSVLGLSIQPLQAAPTIGLGRQQAGPRLNRTAYEQLLKATAGLDSLKKLCFPCYQELTAHHPGFEDSLKQIIQVYYNQFMQPKQNFRP